MLDANWRKSRRSSLDGSCVEVRLLSSGTVEVRDAKDKTGPVLSFTPEEWEAFLDGVQNGEFNLA